MFWLANTNNTSGQYVFYDIKLTKDVLALDIPKASRLSRSVVTEPHHTDKSIGVQWKRPDFSGSQNVDSYISGCTEAYSRTVLLIEDTDPAYKIYTTYLETSTGEICKAISIKIDDEDKLNNGDYIDIPQRYRACLEEMKRLRELDMDLVNLGLAYVNANLGLPELGLKAIAYGKVLKTCREVVKECSAVVKAMKEEKQAEIDMLGSCYTPPSDARGNPAVRPAAAAFRIRCQIMGAPPLHLRIKSKTCAWLQVPCTGARLQVCPEAHPGHKWGGDCSLASCFRSPVPYHRVEGVPISTEMGALDIQ